MNLKLPISAKLPLLVISLSLGAAFAIGGITYTAAVDRIRMGIERDLTSLRDMRSETLKSYLESVEENVDVLASSRSVQMALQDLSRDFARLEGTETEKSLLLQEAYTPNDRSGIPDIFSGAQTSSLSPYIVSHKEHHNWFDLIVSDLGYYDVFLVDPFGNVVYTVTKEKDFGTNLLSGPWSETGLATVFNGAMKNRVLKDDLFADFTHYGPSDGDPAAFMAKPIYSDGNKIGVFAIQMPIDRINEIMFLQAGLGRTGESYVVGNDYYMRTQSRLTGEPTILQRTVSSTSALAALSGASGFDVVSDYRGIPVFSSYRPFRFMGANWAILSEVDVSEAELPIIELRDRVIMTAMIGSALIILLGMLFARSITIPLGRISDAIRLFGETREKAEVPYTNRKDELGDISRVFAEVEDQVTDYVSRVELAEKAVRASADQFKQMLDTSSVGIIIESFEHLILYANPKFSDMVKVERENLIGMHTDEFLPDTSNNKELLEEFESTGFIENYEVTIRAIDNSILETVLSAYPLDYQGKPAIIEWIYDISERKRMEAELHVAKDAAEDGAKAKSAFLAAMSHEIRTPMNGVVGMVDLLMQSRLDADQRQMLNTVRDSGHSLLTIINDILDFSKIEAGKLDIESVDMALVDVVEGAAQTMAPNAVKKGVKLLTYIDPEIAQFKKGDPTRVRQIIINMGGNAIKFSDKGKEVQIRAEKVVCKGADDTRIRFSIVDQGIGISEEAQATLFEEFSQADVSTTRRFGGTGLGLAICKRLTELMGGEIGVQSVLGEGATFWCELPVGVSDKVRPDRKVNDLSGLRVLVVSPSKSYRDICRQYLTHWHAQVEVTKSIEESLKRSQAANDAGEPLDILVIPELDDHIKVAKTRDAFAEAGLIPYPRFVIGEDPRFKSDILQGIEEVTLMDINPMRRAGMLTAVAIAAGKASPEVYQEETVDVLSAVHTPTVDEALAQGKLILLAEDNLTNQLVIRKQLNTLGYQCEIANDGKEGFEMWQQRSYCMLLTDCHMPEWDGFELTDAIRKSEERADQRSPIVAITANALQGEAERCIAAGMDDYMSKPVEMRVLKQTLVKWMGEGSVDDANSGLVTAEICPPPMPDLPSGGDVVGSPVDDRMLKDMFGEDDAMFKEILLSFIEPTEAIIADLETAYDARSAVDIKAQAHKLKSSSRSVGANELADTCLALETAGKEEDWEMIENLAPKVEPLFDEVKQFVAGL